MNYSHSNTPQITRHRFKSMPRREGIMRRDSELFKPLVATAEQYLKDYCDGKQDDDEKARVALRALSVYRRILKLEKERKEIKAEWEKLVAGVNKLKIIMKKSSKQNRGKDGRKIKNKPFQ